MFSKACEYGIRATIYIARESQQGNRSSLKDIAKAINSPVAFTGKILQLLAKNEIVNSIKGAAGGYEIDESDLSEVSLLHIVKAIDGENVYKGCGMGLQLCNETHPCPVHFEFKKIREDLYEMLKNATLLKMVSQENEEIVYLK